MVVYSIFRHTQIQIKWGFGFGFNVFACFFAKFAATPQRHGLPRGRHAAWGAGRFAWWFGNGPWSLRQHLGESHGYQQLV